jgi:Peptidase A4 family
MPDAKPACSAGYCGPRRPSTRRRAGRALAVAAVSAAAAALATAAIVPMPTASPSPARAQLTACPGAVPDAAPGASCGVWSGWVTPSDTSIREVGATFQVPDATCPRAGALQYFWVGVQGWPLGGGGIAQAGVEISCRAGWPSSPLYSVWTGISSGDIVPRDLPVQPGDSITVDAFQLELPGGPPGSWYFMLEDANQNWMHYFALYGIGPVIGGIAAVAAESDAGGLIDGPVSVTNAQVNFSPLGQYAPHPSVQDPSIYQVCGGQGSMALVPSALDTSGQNFLFLWEPGPASPACQLAPTGQIPPLD